MSNEQTVMSVYAAFQRGDVAAIQALVADNVEWKNDAVASRECPWNGNYSGKANLPGFFEAVGGNLDLPVFEVKATAASGHCVAVNLRIEGTVKKTGRAFQNDAIHFWTFDDSGRIAKYQHFNDTAMELAAWRG